MNNKHDFHKEWVTHVFDRAAATYGQCESSFFNTFGKRLVEHANIQSRMHVLDVASGKGAVLFPLSKKVGDEGKVVGIDISMQMIQEAKKLAATLPIQNIKLFQMDAEKLSFDDNSFDAVLCGFSLFFFPDIKQAFSEFFRVLKPNGILAISTWGKRDPFIQWVRHYTREMGAKQKLSLHSFETKEEVESTFLAARFSPLKVYQENNEFIYPSPEAYWNGLWSHGTRSLFEQLSPEVLQKVKAEVFIKMQQRMQADGIHESMQVIYGSARKVVTVVEQKECQDPDSSSCDKILQELKNKSGP